MKTWIPHELDIEDNEVEIHNADATLEVEYEYDCGATDADGRQCSPDGWVLNSVCIASVALNGKQRSREFLVDLCGADAVDEVEDWLLDNLNATEIAREEAEAYADAAADYAAE